VVEQIGQGDRIYLHLGVRRDERGNARQSAGGPGGVHPRLDQSMLFEVGLEAASAQVDPPVKGAEGTSAASLPLTDSPHPSAGKPALEPFPSR
jgi:hypothetical protein